jgi:hypothetical protein
LAPGGLDQFGCWVARKRRADSRHEQSVTHGYYTPPQILGILYRRDADLSWQKTTEEGQQDEVNLAVESLNTVW